MGQRAAEGIITAVIDTGDVFARYQTLTGGAADELTEFTVRLRLEQAGYTARRVERRYVIDRARRSGRRLAWVNRFGVIDYYTFPVVDKFRSAGSRTRVVTADGYRTVATSGAQSIGLLSEPCGAVEAEWLSEIFSSPAVWMIDWAGGFEKVEVEAGEVVSTPLRPTVVSVVVAPGEPPVSRKL
jgi:hypothetical protein